MFTRFFSLEKYALLRKGSCSPSHDEIPLSQIATTTRLRGRVDERDGNQRACNYWHFLCFFLHALLVALHLVLLGVAVSHAEHRIVMPHVTEALTIGLSGGLQTFYTLYTAVLVFLTQKLMLSASFASPKKMTQIHDICGAWAGLGAALNTLWKQTKVASSVLPIALVTVYFACISALHVTSSTLMHFQVFNDTMIGMFPVQETWPNASVDLASLDWMAVTPLVPLLRDLSGDPLLGLANDTLYDVPDGEAFLAVTVNALTLNANCGLLTNLTIDALKDGTQWNVNASMSGLGPISITISYPPLLNEIWFSPSIQCLQPICSTFILFLVSTEMEVDDSVGANHVYINGTYYPPGGTTQNFSTPTYFVACSLNGTNHTVTLGPSEVLLGSGKQLTDAAWSAFSPGGDLNLTSAISYAMTSANSLPLSLYCQPIMSSLPLWENITAFNAYMRSALGMGVSPCFGTPLAQYTSTPPLLTRDQVESAVSQIAAGFIRLAGEVGDAGGGFTRQRTEYPTLVTAQSYRLNINYLPVIFALCASVILLVLIVYALWRRPAASVVSSAGVLEIMWFGSRSRVLRDRLSIVKTASLDSLRASSMFETIFWSRSTYGHEGSSDVETDAARSQEPSGSEFGSPHSTELSQRQPTHTSNISRTRRWCYALHVLLVTLHVALLGLLVHHLEHSVVIPLDSETMIIGLSALLQAIYTLYSALLVLLMQRVAMFKIVSERRKLTTAHDVSGAWTGIGAAIHILWQQRKRPSSIREMIAVGAYLSMMLVLHITSSSIMQWQAYLQVFSTDATVQLDLGMPDSAVNISQLEWTEIFPIARSIQDAGLPTVGLSNSTLYDVALLPDNGPWVTMPSTSSATTLTAQCGLVSNLTLSYQNSEGEYQISFLDGTNSGSFLESPIWKDTVHAIAPTTECIACPQTLFYMIATDINVDRSIHDPVAVELNWTYTPSEGGNPRTSTTLTYIAACSLSQTVSYSQDDPLPDPAASSTSTSWSVWSPENATNLSVGMATALSKDVTSSFSVFIQGNSSAYFTDMDSYVMSSLGLSLTYANETSVSQSSANPSVTLNPGQLEDVIAQTAAMFLWTAGRVGESGGGFQRSMIESQVTSAMQMWRLHVNTIPVLFASIASFLSLILAMIIVGKGPSRERPTSISGASVLECLWLEAQSELLHSHLQKVEEPRLDALRAAGMFDVCLGDIGRSSHPEAERPMLESVDG